MSFDPLPQHPTPRQIPHLEVEDTILRMGPLALSLRQASLLLIGGCVAWSLWKATAALAAWHMPGLMLRLLVAALPVLVSLAFAFGKGFERRYETWIIVIWRYLWLPKVATWRRSAAAQEEVSSRSVLESEGR